MRRLCPLCPTAVLIIRDASVRYVKTVMRKYIMARMVRNRVLHVFAAFFRSGSVESDERPDDCERADTQKNTPQHNVENAGFTM